MSYLNLKIDELRRGLLTRHILFKRIKFKLARHKQLFLNKLKSIHTSTGHYLLRRDSWDQDRLYCP
jgi:hypothetical protein